MANVFHKLPKVLEAAVVDVSDPDWGEKVCTVVVLKPGLSADVSEIQDFCRLHPAEYKISRNVYFVALLPCNTSGKHLKYELRKLLREKQSKTCRV